jgi:hypothetical protein
MPELIKLGTYYPWWREFKFVQIKGYVLFKGEIITKMYKWGQGGGVHLKILFLRTMKPEKLNFTWKLSDMEQRQVDYIMGPRGSNGGNEMHINSYFYMYIDQGYSGERCGPWAFFSTHGSEPGVGWGQNKETIFTFVYIKKFPFSRTSR